MRACAMCMWVHTHTCAQVLVFTRVCTHVLLHIVWRLVWSGHTAVSALSTSASLMSLQVRFPRAKVAHVAHCDALSSPHFLLVTRALTTEFYVQGAASKPQAPPQTRNALPPVTTV